MDFLKQTWERMKDFVKRLSPAQRVSITALSLVVVVAFVLLALSSGQVAMQPLFFEDTPAEVTQDVIKRLDGKGTPYELRAGGRVYVKREDAERLRVELIGEGVAPEGKDPYTWVFEPDILSTPTKWTLEWQVTIQRRLEHMISTIEAIRSAQVAITWVKDREFVFEGAEKPKASVRVTLKQGKTLKQENVLSIARLVAGAVKNLEPKNVYIVDSLGNPHEVPDEDSPDALAAKYREIKVQHEADLEKKARDLLLPLLGPTVVVKAELIIDTKSETDVRTGVDPTRQAETKIEKEKDSNESKETAAAPGVQGNLPPQPEPEAGTGSKETHEKSSSEFENGQQSITKVIPPGTIMDRSLMVVAPYDELLRDPKLPKEKLGKLSDAERTSVYQARVAELTGALSKGTMVDAAKIAFVSYAPPEIEPIPALTWQQETLAFLSEHGDQMALVFIACMGMLMIYRMVKTAVPKDILAEIARLRGEIAAEEAMGPEAAVAKVADSQSAQLCEKVREIIRKDPRTAANLLRRWTKE